MMVISWFFWPSPAVALIGVVLLPAAMRVGLPPIAVAVAMNLFGHGIALSGDFVIQAAPKLTADAAGIPISSVISASVPLVFVMGAVTTIIAFWTIRKDLKSGKLTNASGGSQAGGYLVATDSKTQTYSLTPVTLKVMAVIITLLYVIDVLAMYFLKLQGGDATELLGGTSILILVIISLLAHQSKGLEKITEYLIDGFHFGFKVFGPVIPISAFFYLGDSALIEIFGKVLPAGSNGIVNDLALPWPIPFL
jgi:hypothetical protein